MSSEDGRPISFSEGREGLRIESARISALPGGRGVVVTECRNSCLQGDLIVVDSDGESKVLVPDAILGLFISPDNLVWLQQDGGVFKSKIDLETLELRGTEIPVMDGVRAGLVDADFIVSPNGDLLYVQGLPALSTAATNELVWVDREGHAEPVDSTWTGGFHYVALSPDGRRLAATVGLAPRTDVWVKELPAGPRMPLTNDALRNRRPHFTADGTRVAWQREVDDNQDFMIRRADGSAPAEPLLSSRAELHSVTFSVAGPWMLYRRGSVQGIADIYVMDMDRDSVGHPLLTGQFMQKAPSLSPDGQWIAFVSNESGRDEVYVRPFPDVGTARTQVSVSGGFEPRWSPTDDELFYRSAGEGMMMSAAFEASPEFRVVEREPLFSWTTSFRSSDDSHAYDVSPDARRFLMSTRPRRMDSAVLEDQPELILVENWIAELDALSGRSSGDRE